MRAPPDDATEISGIDSSSARSTARANFSPTTEPIEPPMNWNSIVASAQRCPSISALPTTIASSRPVALGGGGEALRVRLDVDERERVGRAQTARGLLERARIGELRDALERADEEVVPQVRQTRSSARSSSSR